MEFRHLGRSGLIISEIAYGNWLTHGSQIDEKQAAACVHAALDVGITTFDTADVYAATAAETALGKALKGQRRESLEIFTKVYWPTGPGRNDVGLSRKHIVESCNASLRRLQTDYVDLYQAHRFDYETPLEETLRAFDDLVRAGKVLYVGVSEWRASEIEQAVAIARDMGFDRIISNQPQYSMLWRVPEDEVIPLCEREGISQIVWSPIAQGVLTGKYVPDAAPPAGSRAVDEAGGKDDISWLLDRRILTQVQDLRPIADDVGLSMAQLAIAWVLQNPNVASAIVGASRPEQLTENAKAAGVTLGQEIIDRIDKALDGVILRGAALTGSPNPRPLGE